jgi:hypothetical protein
MFQLTLDQSFEDVSSFVGSITRTNYLTSHINKKIGKQHRLLLLALELELMLEGDVRIVIRIREG